jgi:Predicted membrane protein (DUF2306)
VSKRTGRLHRYFGRAYVVVVLLSAAAAMMLVAYGSAIAPAFGAILLCVAAIWSAYTILGLLAARRRQLQCHREWMIRSYAVTLGFVVFRLLVELPILAAWTFRDRYTALVAITFLSLLATTEIMLQWRRVASSLSHTERSDRLVPAADLRHAT